MHTQSHPRVLLADDDAPFRVAMSKALKRRGFSVTPLNCGMEAVSAMRNVLDEGQSTVTVLDLRMPDIDGLEVLRQTPDRRTPVIVLTGHGSVPDAVEAMRLGAYTFLTKPVDAHDLIPIIMQAAEPETPTESMVGESPGLQTIHEIVKQVGASSEPVFLRGEPGVGKKLVARMLHDEWAEPGASMVVINARVSPETDELKELRSVGRGTLFIDELSALSLAAQAKLLDVIDNRVFIDEQSGTRVIFNGRVVVASNTDLQDGLNEGRILGDLYHRLQVIPLEVQSLRDRPEDIMPVLRHWLSVLGTDNPSFDVDAVAALTSHDWPGNVRELVNLARRLALFGDEGRIGADLVLRMLETNPFAPARTDSTTTETDVVEEISLEELERRHIEALMAHHRNISRVSRILGINRRTLQRKLRCWGHDYQPLNGS